MKKLLGLALLFCSLLAAGQVQIFYNTQTSPPRVLAKGILWNNLSNSVFVYYPSPSATGACFTITNNNPTNAHTVGLSIWQTTDPAQITTYPNLMPGNRWFLLYSNSGSSVGTNNSNTLYVPTAGAAQIAFTFGAVALAGTPDTVDISEVDTFGGASCLNSASGNQNTRPSTACTNVNNPATTASGTITLIASAGFTTLGAPPSTAPTWHICSYTITGADSTTSASLDIGFGNSPTTCASITPRWSILAHIGIINYSLAGGSGELFEFPSGGNALCYRDNGTTTGTRISVAYDFY